MGQILPDVGDQFLARFKNNHLLVRILCKVEIVEFCFPVQEPVHSLDSGHIDVTAEFVGIDFAERFHVLDVQTSEGFSFFVVVHLGKIKGTVCKGVFIFGQDFVMHKVGVNSNTAGNQKNDNRRPVNAGSHGETGSQGAEGHHGNNAGKNNHNPAEQIQDTV